MKYSKEILAEETKKTTSMSGLMRNLGISCISGGMHAHLKKRLKQENIDTSHWCGRTWNKGQFIPRRKLGEILAKRRSTRKESTRTILRALLLAGVPYQCSECGITNWRGKFLRLHVEHKNGDNLDNRKDNLTFLCPNCHSQTETYGVIRSKRGCGGTGRRSGLSYGSLTEKLVSRMLSNSANPSLATPSQDSREEGVETKREPPKAKQNAMVKT